MDVLIMEKTPVTPAIKLDPTTGLLEIAGRSLPEDVTNFYDPIIDWIHEYKNSMREVTTFEIRLDYFNTASSKKILDILLLLNNLGSQGNKIVVNWYYEEEDDDMMEAGEEYSAITPFVEFKTVEC